MNYHVRCRDRTSVAACIAALAPHDVVVTRPRFGWTTILQPPGLDESVKQQLAATMSSQLGTIVFVWGIIDDDVTQCHLWHNGKLRFAYDSCPEYYGTGSDNVVPNEAPLDSPDTLLEFCVGNATVGDVEAALRRTAEDPVLAWPVMETDRVLPLASLLGIDVEIAQTSFADVQGRARSSPRSRFRLVGRSAGNAARPDIEEFDRLLRSAAYATIEAMVTRGLDPHAQTGAGRTVLSDVLNARAWPVMRAFVQAGLSPSRVLHWCALQSAEETAWLIARGAAVDSLDGNGYTALLRAISVGNVAAINVLLDAGADVNRSHDVRHVISSARHNGQTALMLAARRGDIDVVAMLLEAGADPRLTDATGRTALDKAVEANRTKVAHMLSRPPKR